MEEQDLELELAATQEMLGYVLKIHGPTLLTRKDVAGGIDNYRIVVENDPEADTLLIRLEEVVNEQS